MTITPVEQAVASLGVAGVAGVVALSFTPSDINTAIIGITALVTATGIVVVNIMNARAMRRAIKEEIKPVIDKADVIAMTTAKIDGHVNSEKTAGEGRENTLKRENELLREQLTEMKTAAALLAQATATIPSHPPAASVEGASPAASLKQIDKNTAAIEKNTASTEAKVDDAISKAPS